MSEESHFLSEQKKARIRAEEIYRTEIRKELNAETQATSFWRKVLGFFNLPVGIWVLSSVLVGGVASAYTIWRENQSEHESDEQEATATFFEAQFRMKQLESVVDNNSIGTLDSVVRLAVTVKLGGIASFPLGEEGTLSIGSSGYGRRHLPYGRGFQNENYFGQSLFNLWYAHHTLTCGKRPDKDLVGYVNQHLKELDSSVSFERGQLTEETADSNHRRIIMVWESVKKIEGLGVFLEPSPRFDSNDHCNW